MKHQIRVIGGCHCGAVQFEAMLNKKCEVQICNCSMCSMCGFQHLIVPSNSFRLVAGESSLSEYQFKSKTARHYFCSKCGIKSFYVPRSNPDGYSLNVRCLEMPGGVELDISEFDGRNWEKNAADLAHLSVDDDS